MFVVCVRSRPKQPGEHRSSLQSAFRKPVGLRTRTIQRTLVAGNTRTQRDSQQLDWCIDEVGTCRAEDTPTKARGTLGQNWPSRHFHCPYPEPQGHAGALQSVIRARTSCRPVCFFRMDVPVSHAPLQAKIGDSLSSFLRAHVSDRKLRHLIATLAECGRTIDHQVSPRPVAPAVPC